MEAVDITTYLQKAFELEASLDRQSRAIKEAKKMLEFKNPKEPDIKMPKKHVVSEPVIKNVEGGKAKAGAYGVLIFGIIIFIASFWIGGFPYGVLLMGVILGGPFIYMGVWFINKFNEEAKKIEEFNKESRNRYEKDVVWCKSKNEEELKAYYIEVEKAQKKYEVEKKGCAIGKEAVKKMELSCNKTRDTLKRLYDLNVIFPKYRNLVAISTMYEYLASGRCSQLTGPDGAYNLFESELRQNIIIGELGMIIRQLEDIKQSQYMLYSELKKSNKILSDISSDMTKLVETAQDISQAAKITAYYSQVTAENTEALKYIALING